MNMNLIDRMVAYFNPQAALQRGAARHALNAMYEGAEGGRMRRLKRDAAPNALVQRSSMALRAQARHLERNHDISRGILRTMVNSIVGPNGIGIEPQPRRADGSIHEEYAATLRELYRDWCKRPEVTARHTFPAVQRLMARAWLRDGEAFAQMLIGPVAKLNHGTRVPFSLELFESDMVPLDYEANDNIKQGVERNGWGQPVGFWVYRHHPLESRMVSQSDLRRISADRMLHLAMIDRIGQLRGVSEFASVITRLDDIKDYEESERVAAKIAAMMTAYVKRGSPDIYQQGDTEEPREMRMQPGMIIDSLRPGEEIGLIDSNRPNPNLITFRQGQLRAIAAGVGASYSSVSRDYNGTYSAQRQELVEQWVNYAVLTDEFTGQIVQPVWETFVMAAHLSGQAPIPPDVRVGSAGDALYIAQAMPWIDPLKEAKGWETLVNNRFASPVEVIRRRGGNPNDVLDQTAAWQKQLDKKGLSGNGSAGSDPAPEPAQ